MDITYDAASGVLRVTLSGAWPRGAGHRDLPAPLAALGVPADAPVLVDCRGVDVETAPRYQEAVTWSDTRLAGIHRRAYLVLPGTQFGVARMIQALAPDDVEMQVFTEETEAIAWLRQR